MIHQRVPVIVALLLGSIFLSLAGASLAPRGASAGPIVRSNQNTRSIDPYSFALAAKHIVALRGVQTTSLVHRFTSLARTDSTDGPGSQAGGETTLVNNWHISPAGSEASLGDFPANSALSPDGTHMLIVNSGAGVQSLQVVDSSRIPCSKPSHITPRIVHSSEWPIAPMAHTRTSPAVERM